MKNMITKLVTLGLLIVVAFVTATSAFGYMNFEKVDIVGPGKFLNQYTDADYQEHYKKVDKRKFIGWNIHYVNKDMKIKYVSETLFSYYNNGKTPISYTYSSTTKEESHFEISVSGNLTIKTQKTNKIFGDGLNASIKIDTKYKQSLETTEKKDIKLSIDPGTQLIMYYYGEGLVTNGVASSYVFWIRTRRGGFEYFAVTTLYPRLELKPV